MVWAFLGSIYRQIAALDLDEIFSYQTTKEVRMLDRRLGMVNWLIRLVVLAYVIGYVFILREGYTETEKSVGNVISSVNGTTYSQVNGVVRPWDSVDAVQPFLENGAAFITTQVYVTPGQTIRDTGNPNQPCSSDSQCPKVPGNPLIYGRCADELCQEKAWAPVFSVSDTKNTQGYQLETADQFNVWIRSAIQFPSLDPTRLFSTIGAVHPTPFAGRENSIVAVTDTSSTLGDGTSEIPDFFTLGELLSLAQTSFETIRQTGCTLEVSYEWTCFVDSNAPCYPVLQVARMDTNERRRGFAYQYANYYRPVPDGPDTRDLNTVHGVRLLIVSRGLGKRVSISAIMLQISSMIALLWLANFAADFLMLHVLPERKHYRTYKQERTPDFSDLRNKIAEVEGEKKKLRDRKNRFAAKLDES